MLIPIFDFLYKIPLLEPEYRSLDRHLCCCFLADIWHMYAVQSELFKQQLQQRSDNNNIGFVESVHAA